MRPNADLGPVQPDLIGRYSELAQIDALLKAGQAASATMVLIGDPGVGKSALLAEASVRAEMAGMRILSAAGIESESQYAFAGLHQLLRPIMSSTDRIPPRQADAIRTAFGIADGPNPDRFLVGIATLGMLADAADQSPLLVVVDDAHSFDPGSLDALTFAVRRLQAERIGVIVASRDGETAIAFDRAEVLSIEPLAHDAAESLLDRNSPWLHGAVRQRVLREGNGNPLALLELGLAAKGQARGPSPQVALPATVRMEQLFAHRLADLPAETRRLLILAVANDNNDLQVVLRAGESLGLDARHLVPAEQRGLIVVSGDALVWRHPLARSVVYHLARTDERREAHQALAAVLASETERSAWHLAATASGPDEAVAAALEAAADTTRLRTGFDASARALVRAADLSPDPEDRARRLVLAAETAVAAGRPRLVIDLVIQIEESTIDPRLRARAALCRAHLATTVGSSIGRITSGEELGRALAADPMLGVRMLITAAGQTYLTADPALREAVQGIARSLPGTGGEAWRLNCLAASDASLPASDFAPHLEGLAAQAAADPGIERIVALMYWHLDQQQIAWDMLSSIVDRMRGRELGDLPAMLVTLALISISRGRWADAQALAADTAQLAADVGQPLMAAASHALEAVVAALVGDRTAVVDHADAAIRGSDEVVVLAMAAWARGLDALSRGENDEAVANLAPIMTPGSPAGHPEVARWAIGDFTEAARSDPPSSLAPLVRRLSEIAEAAMSPRARLTARRAVALLADDDQADELFRLALDVREANQWPFEVARTRLAHGEWLRRHRRIREARPMLRAAAETFAELGAREWIERAAAELRSAGVVVEARRRPVIDELTAQQRQVAQLAARGLSNAEIASMLYLSPRTVSFHLYNAFPKLGVTTRTQLARALESLESPVTTLVGETAEGVTA